MQTLKTIIEALQQVDFEEAVKRKAIEDLQERILHQRIRDEYKLQKKNRPGESEQIKSELAEKYYNNSDRVRMINSILYEKYQNSPG